MSYILYSVSVSSSLRSFWSSYGSIISSSMASTSHSRLQEERDDEEHRTTDGAICGSCKAKQCTIIAGFLFIIILLSSIWLLVRFVAFGDVVYDTSVLETRPVADQFSYTMCEGITTSSYIALKSKVNTMHDAYLFCNGEPALSTHRESFEFDISDYIDGHTYHHYDYYLLTGSEVKLTTCAHNSQIDMYLIDGSTNFTDWKKERDLCDSCYINKIRLPDCNVVGPMTVQININVTSRYYLVFYNLWPPSLGYSKLDIAFLFNRTVYDTSNVTDSCLNVRQCSFTYPHKNCQTIVKPLPFAEGLNDVKLKLELTPRQWSYFAFFLILPCLLFLIIYISLMFHSDVNDKGVISGRTVRRGQQEVTGSSERPTHVNSEHGYHVPPPYEEDETSAFSISSQITIET